MYHNSNRSTHVRGTLLGLKLQGDLQGQYTIIRDLGRQRCTMTAKAISEILYLFLAEKIVVCLVVCFVATLSLSDFGLHFFLIEALIELRKMLIRKKLFNERLFAHCSTPKVLMFCRFTGFTKMQLI